MDVIAVLGWADGGRVMLQVLQRAPNARATNIAYCRDSKCQRKASTIAPKLSANGFSARCQMQELGDAQLHTVAENRGVLQTLRPISEP